jgi:hypothetical protein
MSPKAASKPIVTLYFVNKRTCFAKLRPADTHVPAFKPHVTMLSVMVLREYKANVKFPTPSLLKHHVMKKYVEGRHSCTFLHLRTRRRRMVTSTQEKTRRTHCIEAWTGPSAYLYFVEYSKFFYPLQGIVPLLSTP